MAWQEMNGKSMAGKSLPRSGLVQLLIRLQLGFLLIETYFYR